MKKSEYLKMARRQVVTRRGFTIRLKGLSLGPRFRRPRTISSISVSGYICNSVLVQRRFFTMPLTNDL